jgi:hypothetical protein
MIGASAMFPCPRLSEFYYLDAVVIDMEKTKMHFSME